MSSSSLGRSSINALLASLHGAPEEVKSESKPKPKPKPISPPPSEPYDLNKLKHFSQALVYARGTEASVKEPIEGSETVDKLKHQVGQVNDIFNAHYYVENSVLPLVKKTPIESKQLLEWINEIHRRIAYTLAVDRNMEEEEHAGKYAKTPIIRWHHGEQYILKFFKEMHALPLSEATTRFWAALPKSESNVSEKDASDFIRIILQVQNAPPISPEEPNEKKRWTIMLSKLCDQYHNDKFSSEDKICLNKFLQCMPSSSQVPELMRKFGEEVSKMWIECKANNLEEVANTAAFIFREFNKIHPFLNGNKRTATLLLNLFLVSQGKPSILLYLPNDKASEISYQQAIRQYELGPDRNAEEKSDLLAAHIKSSILKESQQPYKNLVQARLVASQVKLEPLVRLHSMNDAMWTKAALQCQFAAVKENLEKTLSAKGINEKDIESICFGMSNESTALYLSQWSLLPTPTISSSSASFFVGSEKNSTNEEIKRHIDELTHKSCTFDQDTPLFFIECEEKEAHQIAQELVKVGVSAKCMQEVMEKDVMATSIKEGQRKLKFYVQIEISNPKTFLQIKQLEGLALGNRRPTF